MQTVRTVTVRQDTAARQDMLGKTVVVRMANVQRVRVPMVNVPREHVPAVSVRPATVQMEIVVSVGIQITECRWVLSQAGRLEVLAQVWPILTAAQVM